MKPDILLIEPMMASIEESLDQNYVVHRLFASTDPMSLLANIGTRIRGVATGGGSGVSPTIFDALPNLEIIAINGVGTDAVDLNKAKARGVRVTTTPNVLTDDVADLGIALLLAVSRGLCVGDKRRCRWRAKLQENGWAFLEWGGSDARSLAAPNRSI
jgi:lactate dehydrogenase-like 2-hydroxyacid dehydrogenase